MKMFGDPKREFFTSKDRLNFEVYGQREKITLEAGGKGPFFASEVITGFLNGSFKMQFLLVLDLFEEK